MMYFLAKMKDKSALGVLVLAIKNLRYKGPSMTYDNGIGNSKREETNKYIKLYKFLFYLI